MAFEKIQAQYRSCSIEAGRIIRLAEMYGADCDYPGGNSSKYFDIHYDQEDLEKMCSASCRVSRHDPNYALRGDDDIMVYVGGLYGDWLNTAEEFCNDFERYFECERPAKVKSYLQGLRTRRETKIRKEKEREEECQRLMKIRLKDAGDMYEAVLHNRCAAQKISKGMIEAAFKGLHDDAPCGIYTQLRKWFRSYTLKQALKFVV